jgi:hypothetical protein
MQKEENIISKLSKKMMGDLFSELEMKVCRKDA